MNPAQSWLWPDRVIGKRESRALREEHNRLVNAHVALVEACKLSRVNVGELAIRLAPTLRPTERKALETWLGELNAALARSNVF